VTNSSHGCLIIHRSVEVSPKLWARIAGAFYLATIVAGVFAEAFVRGALIVRNDPAATSTNILTHELLYRTGLVADLVMLASYIAVTLLFYRLFRPVSKSLSMTGAFFSLVGIGVLAVNSLTHVAPLIFLAPGDYLSAFSTTQLQVATLVALCGLCDSWCLLRHLLHHRG